MWKSRISSLSDVGLPNDASSAEGFEIEYMHCDMGEVVFNSGYFATQTLRHLSRRPRSSAINQWFLFHLRFGEAWFDTRGRRLHARPGAMFLISLNEEFQGQIMGYEGQLLILPREAFAGVAGDLDGLSNTLLSGSLAELLATYLNSLETHILRMSVDELRVAGRATAELIATCLRPSLDKLGQTSGQAESALFRRARAYIQQHLNDIDLGPERLMSQLRISRSNLYRAFEELGGVAAYIQRQRLLSAHADLVASPEMQVQAIAYRYGFSSASDFARAFRREFGHSPRQLRHR
ncbi:helix-turn-helix domain-containing protein [Labrys sp. La1]|uniref:helix-turn-helix domain-containing protein n=1 Tax=Labrys sp. La1 TaxID=3404917 RepID=UPI003EB84713